MMIEEGNIVESTIAAIQMIYEKFYVFEIISGFFFIYRYFFFFYERISRMTKNVKSQFAKNRQSRTNDLFVVFV